MHRRWASFILAIGMAAGMASPSAVRAEVEKISPSAIGWGNLLVPGLGATLRDRPWLGLTEAGLAIGTFYGGALLSHEGRFKIDGTIELPESGDVHRAVGAQILQQFGLKYHFYNTFYHYQQASLEMQDDERELSNPQPLYKGTWKDMLEAPFKWENLSNKWTWPILLGGAAYLVYDYSTTAIQRRSVHLSPGGEALHLFSETAVYPMGSSFGEDVLFRGFIQREVRGATHSLPVSILAQAIPFALLHDNRPTAFMVGTYFGFVTDREHGDLGSVMATHFWINVVDGLFHYFALRRAQGESAPLNPPLIGAKVDIPF